MIERAYQNNRRMIEASTKDIHIEGAKTNNQKLIDWIGETARLCRPGYGEKTRGLRWILDRVHGNCRAIESPFGLMPLHQDIRWEGLNYDPDTFYELMEVDRWNAKGEASSHEELFDKFFDCLPKEFIHHRELF